MATISYAGGSRLAIVPEGNTVQPGAKVDGKETFEVTVPKEAHRFPEPRGRCSAGPGGFPLPHR